MTYPWRTAVCLFACAYGALSQQPPVSLEQAIAHARDLYSRGKPAQAEALLKQAIDDSGRDPYGDPKRYDALKLLYSIVDVARPGPEAEQYLQGAINFREVTLGNLDDPRLAEDLKELAMFCGRIKDHDRGITILQRVLSIQITAGGPKSPDLVETYIRSAQLYNGKKAHENARSALRAALSVAEHNHGPEHPSLVPVLDPLASTLVLLRQYEQASEIFRRDLLIRERLFGTSSMELIATLDGLAYSYFGEKKYGEAEPVYKRLLGIWVDSAGPDH
ncbi:MAG TPA: tetratricopeptide repeat protein, partial [Bryobacteraceae bacterium]|nr:tetratricopeptide repeat protein [Bryobacteraceae bacterium]